VQTLTGLDTAALTSLITSIGQPAYRGKQLAESIYSRRVRSLDEITTLPVALRQTLSENYTIGSCKVIGKQEAVDGTVKYLLSFNDGEVVETVFLPYENRTSICISSQVGCPMGCSFCATGTEGLVRNLTTAEIIDQLLIVQALHPETRISHVVMMGMGEPLLNLPNVIAALTLMANEVGLSWRHLTVSTVGVIPAIEKLAQMDLPLTLAVSLHAPTDDLRDELVPLNRKHNIARLMQACSEYVYQTNRRLTFEYVLLAGVNDRDEDAHALGKLLAKQPLCALNTIPYNSTDVEAAYKRPQAVATHRFRDIVASYGVTVTQRQERGQKIAAACGQLKRSALRSGHSLVPLQMLKADA
jgi:23S rRNA (adenine2503-C2)-methyltransferase